MIKKTSFLYIPGRECTKIFDKVYQTQKWNVHLMCERSITSKREHRGCVMVNTPDSLLTHFAFETSFWVFEHWARPLTTCYSSPSGCMNECLPINSGGHLCKNSLCVVNTTWLNASQRCHDGGLVCQREKTCWAVQATGCRHDTICYKWHYKNSPLPWLTLLITPVY